MSPVGRHAFRLMFHCAQVSAQSADAKETAETRQLGSQDPLAYLSDSDSSG